MRKILLGLMLISITTLTGCYLFKVPPKVTFESIRVYDTEGVEIIGEWILDYYLEWPVTNSSYQVNSFEPVFEKLNSPAPLSNYYSISIEAHQELILEFEFKFQAGYTFESLFLRYESVYTKYTIDDLVDLTVEDNLVKVKVSYTHTNEFPKVIYFENVRFINDKGNGTLADFSGDIARESFDGIYFTEKQ